MSLRHILTVFFKQGKDIMRNRTILIQFVLFPVLAAIMEYSVKPEELPEHFFIYMFAAMYFVMAPLTGMSAVIAEEKEKNTLRVLLMADVTPAEYLAGTGGCIFLAGMAGSCMFAVCGGFSGGKLAWFLLMMAAGTAVSLVAGAAIGVWSRNQTSAASLSVPVMMVFSFLPMLSMFNEAVGRAAKYAYSQQIYRLMAEGNSAAKGETGIVLAGNFLAVFLIFRYVCGRQQRGSKKSANR